MKIKQVDNGIGQKKIKIIRELLEGDHVQMNTTRFLAPMDFAQCCLKLLMFDFRNAP